MNAEAVPPICDYEGSAYRTEFWGQGRDYEDTVERAALRRLLPPAGHRLIDIGGGYGRLAPLYDGYDEVVIFDYALSQLRQAQELWGEAGPGGGPRYIYVAGDFYQLPFAPALFDTVMMVRTLHHAVDAPSVLRGVSRILAPDGAFVLEFANKRNLKAILRRLVGRQDWSPFDREPVEFVELNFDFHPAWIAEHLSAVGLRVQKRIPVSHFRVGFLKRLVPTRVLAALDRLCQPLSQFYPLSPSVFLRCEAEEGEGLVPDDAFFRCPACGSTELSEEEGNLICIACDSCYAVRDGIYDFKEPIF
jgi:SAM-dependent methyltransferase